jgi:hypothetical protein
MDGSCSYKLNMEDEKVPTKDIVISAIRGTATGFLLVEFLDYILKFFTNIFYYNIYK